MDPLGAALAIALAGWVTAGAPLEAPQKEIEAARLEIERAIAQHLLPCEAAIAALCRSWTPASRALDPIYERFVGAIDRFVAIEPESERSGSLAYEAAMVYLVHGDLIEAALRLRVIADRHAGQEAGHNAKWLLIESEFIGLDEAPPDINWTEEQYARFLDHVLACSRFTSWQRARTPPPFGTCRNAEAERHLEIALDRPASTYSDRALYNAAVIYERSRCFESAGRAYRMLFEQYPKSGLAAYGCALQPVGDLRKPRPIRGGGSSFRALRRRVPRRARSPHPRGA